MSNVVRTGRTTLLGVLVSVVALVALMTPASAGGGVEDESLSPEELHSQQIGETLNFDPDLSVDAVAGSEEGENITVRAAKYTVTCNVTADNPHISEGARKKGQIYVIYKSRVKCTGTGAYPPQVTIRVRGSLLWDSAKSKGDTSNGIKWSSLRSSNEPRVVKVNGKQNTFYTPQSGTGAYFTGHYQGSSTVQITAPTGQKSGSDISGVVFCKPTTKTARCS